MGQGRNAIYLAKQGWRVTGFDVSKAGLVEAQRLAKLAGVSIQTVLASDEEFDFRTEQWDLVAILSSGKTQRVPRAAGSEERRNRGNGMRS